MNLGYYFERWADTIEYKASCFKIPASSYSTNDWVEAERLHREIGRCLRAAETQRNNCRLTSSNVDDCKKALQPSLDHLRIILRKNKFDDDPNLYYEDVRNNALSYMIGGGYSGYQSYP